MSISSKPKDLGPLARSALSLEHDFQEVERLNSALAELTKGPKDNLQHAQKLLVKFSEVGLRIGEEIQILAKALDEGRQRTEIATEGVAKAAAFIRKRQEEGSSISDRFQSLAKRVQEVSASLADLGRSTGGTMSLEETTKLRARLPELEQQLGVLVDDAWKIKEEAREAKFKDLERDANAMVKNLRTTRQKVKVLFSQQK